MMMKRALCIRGNNCTPLTFKQRFNCVVLHDPELRSEQIADRAQMKHHRLLAYASETHVDQPPFLKVLAVAAVTGRWDLVDAALEQYQRRTIAIDTVAIAGDPLDQAVDVCAVAMHVLKEIRDMRRGGYDQAERARLRELIRQIRTEVDELAGTLDEPAGPRRVGATS